MISDYSNEAIQQFFKLVESNNNNRICIDRSHNIILFGSIISSKPISILELGIGMGYATKSILLAIKYNNLGKLTCVDSCKDFAKIPNHFDELKNQGANIIIDQEESFINKQNPETYDFLVSDADHKKSITWIKKTISIMKKDSIMFFHDTNNIEELKNLESQLNKLGIFCIHFKKSSLPYERCERGWLMAYKKNNEYKL